MATIDSAIAPILIGTLISILLTGIMIIQTYNYFLQFPKDKGWFKAMVIYLLFTSLINAGVESAVIYQYTITYFGNLTGILFPTSLISCIPAFTSFISIVVQCFYAWRVSVLTKIKSLAWIITLLAIAQFLCGLGVSIGLGVISTSELGKIDFVVIPWFTLSALCDVLITVSLIWYLKTNRSVFPSTDTLITRLIRATIQTGFLTTLVALLDLAVFNKKANAIHWLFCLPLSKLYSVSLMSTLNARMGQADVRQAPIEAGSNDDLSDTWGFKTNIRLSSATFKGSSSIRELLPTYFRNSDKPIISITKRVSINEVHDIPPPYHQFNRGKF